MLIDIDAETYVGAETEEGGSRQVWIVHCGDPMMVDKFTGAALKGVKIQKPLDRLVRLATCIRARGNPTEGEETELNNINVALTKILLKSDSSLKPQPRSNRRGVFKGTW